MHAGRMVGGIWGGYGGITGPVKGKRAFRLSALSGRCGGELQSRSHRMGVSLSWPVSTGNVVSRSHARVCCSRRPRRDAMGFLLVLLGLVLLACGAYVERRAHERRRGRSMSMDTEMTCAEEEELPVTPPKRYRPPGWAKEAVPTNGAPGPSLLSAVGSIVLLA